MLLFCIYYLRHSSVIEWCSDKHSRFTAGRFWIWNCLLPEGPFCVQFACFTPCLRGFFPGALVFSDRPRVVCIRLMGFSKLPLGVTVNGCLSFCVVSDRLVKGPGCALPHLTCPHRPHIDMGIKLCKKKKLTSDVFHLFLFTGNIV